MTAYYNEIDPFKAEVLREAVEAGAIAPGDVDERSIADVRPDELRGYRQCHFFAGGGFWSLALRQAGWPDDRPAWSGSCPCPSFSAAGKGAGFSDPRHLWPDWFRLIAEFALQSSLANRLVQRLDTAGSTLFNLTWRERTTPLGRRYLERAASGRRTSGNGFTSVPTPQTADMTGGGQAERALMKRRPSGAAASANLNDHVMLAAITTPSKTDGERGGTMTPAMSGSSLVQLASLASLPTPIAGSPRRKHTTQPGTPTTRGGSWNWRRRPRRARGERTSAGNPDERWSGSPGWRIRSIWRLTRRNERPTRRRATRISGAAWGNDDTRCAALGAVSTPSARD